MEIAQHLFKEKLQHLLLLPTSLLSLKTEAIP